MKYLYLILFLCLPICVFALSPAHIGTAGGIVSEGCPSQTYMAYWDGDTHANVLTGCLNSGASTVTATEEGSIGSPSTSFGEGSPDIGVQIDADNEALKFTTALANWLDEDEFTICIRLLVVNDDTDNDFHPFESYADANDEIWLRVKDTRRMTTYIEYGGTAVTDNTALENLTEDTWETLCWSYDYVDGAGNDCLAWLNCGTDDNCTNDGGFTEVCTYTGTTGFTDDPSFFRIGAVDSVTNGSDVFKITKLITLTGAKQTINFSLW